jgi:2-succinyl-5-enolpyruvyl-6-hydroxy-3-cyclohexene-1-carboxylate synthase
MPHPKQHITDLAEICLRKGVDRVVISPGSRSAPLIKAFYKTFGENCISIVDERSAAYFALGIAAYTQKPVALICTSGTAVLNYGSAMAEAYYQQVPLLAVTADRPREWIDQQDNQTLRQNGLFQNFIKGSYELPQVITSDDDLWFTHRMVNEAVDLCMTPGKGPVHINVPLTEPLYDELPPPSENIRIIFQIQPAISVKLPDELITEWKNARKIMIIHGQDIPDSEVSHQLPLLLSDGRIIIIAENIANISGINILTNSNLVLSSVRDNSPDYPDLIIHSGGQVVSKSLVSYLRRAGIVKCWRIGVDKGIIDTFKQATRYIPLPAAVVYHALAGSGTMGANKGYGKTWQAAANKANILADSTVQKLPFSDVQVFKHLSRSIPAAALVVLGNSSIIRYSQLFPAHETLSYYSNRGVSGIDGSLSAATGLAFASKKLTIAITGDLGFLYDSNALWNRELPANLRILVINNEGGGIFHILKGPSEHPGFKKFIEAHHPVNIHKLAEAYGLDYLFADDVSSLTALWPDFIFNKGRSIVFEVKTNPAISASAFRKLMSSHR